MPNKPFYLTPASLPSVAPPPQVSEWEDIAAAVDSIGTSVDVVAHSLGATCALEAARLIRHVRRLVLYEPPMPFGRHFWSPDLSRQTKALLDAGEREHILLVFCRDVLRMPSVRSLPSRKHRGGKIAAAHRMSREMEGLDSYVFAPAEVLRLDCRVRGQDPSRREAC